METAKDAQPDEKDAAAVKKYFQKVYPNMDFERVYNSDLKKMVKWYGIIKANDIELKMPELEAEEVEAEIAPAAVAAPMVEEVAAPAPKKKAAPKKKKAEE
jgi:hypothetical protein